MLEKLLTSEKAYIVLVNTTALYDKAIELGYQDLALVTGNRLSPAEVEKLAALQRFVLLYFDCPEGNPQLDQIHRQLKDADIKCDTNNLASLLDFSLRADTIPASEKMFTLEELENYLANVGYIPSTDYTNRCGNCQEYMGKEDKYCKYCGTARGKGAFKPYYNQIHVVYGPPISARHKCKKCGHLWVENTLGGDEPSYCPNCGSKNIKVVSSERFDRSRSQSDYFEMDDLFEED